MLVMPGQIRCIPGWNRISNAFAQEEVLEVLVDDFFVAHLVGVRSSL
ncbi:hypothetical protein [Faecalibaculum rodentium]|nr:hypothetical protein [Faecalibaculum rodentium]